MKTRTCFGASFIALCQLANAQAPPIKLTLREAEALALKNHPQIQAAQHEASAANQEVIEARAPYYPAVNGEVTGSAANNQARVAAGALPASRLFNREAEGIVVSQLITDFGRTGNLVASSRAQARASAQDYQASRYNVLLAVNNAYYDVLRAQALVKVAEQTVAARQLLLDQVTSLAQNKLKSQLDVSFAGVNVSQAQLLLIGAQNNVQETFAALTRALGSEQNTAYDLAEEPLPASPGSSSDALVAQAIGNRPELASLRFSLESARRFEQAEKDLKRPTVGAVAVAGVIPYIDQVSTIPTPRDYEGGAINVSIPIFNGHLFTAREEAARYRALAADQRLRDEQEQLTRDVRAAWANANTAYQRIDVTAQFLRQATLAMNLAQGRYDLGLSSIVELTQAQLNVTDAEIENLSAKYDYQSQYAVLQYAIGSLR
jgi:outer membrane protein